MIIKLPICIDDKIVFQNFIINKTNKDITIYLLKKNYEIEIEKIKIPCCNTFQGISYMDIYCPLTLQIIDKKLLFNNFFERIFYSQNNLSIDFFSLLENKIKKEYDLDFIKQDELEKYETIIWNHFNNIKLSIEVNDNIIYNLWEIVKIYLNYGMFFIYQTDEKNIDSYRKKHSISKRFVQFTNKLLLIKYSIHASNDYTFIEHKTKLLIRKIKQNNNMSILDFNEIKIGSKYFIKTLDNNKFINIKVNNIFDNIISSDNNSVFIYSNYLWDVYIPSFEIKYEQLFYYLLSSKDIYYEIFNTTNLKIERIHTDKILMYYGQSNAECNLIYFRTLFEQKYNDFEILKRNNYSNNFFIYITKQYSKNISDVIKILSILFENYTYPIKFNKLNSNFDQIIYYSLYNINYLFIKDNEKITFINEVNNIIPVKLKMLYYNILKLFYQILNNSYDFLIFTNKFYNDYLHRVIIKNILFLPSLSNEILNEKFNITQINRIGSIIKNILLCSDVVNRLTWQNLPKRLYYLDILYKNKDLLFYIDKLNRNIFPETYDTRLKKILENKFELFKYLRKENDFSKWLKFIGQNVMELFYTPISLSSDDINNLGKLIYLMINVKEQNIKDESYLRFITFGQKNSKLLLDNMRVNLKIREHFGFIKYNLNLGYLAKHLTFNKEVVVELNEESNKDNEILYLQAKLKKITKKYYKYKTKYMIIKHPEKGEYILSQTSQNDK